MILLTIACPEQHIHIGNQFSRCVGLGPDDDKTFGLPLRQDAEGNLYAASSGLVSPHFLDVATSELQEPSWGCDIEAARTAQALIRLDALATPDTITAIIRGDALSSLAAMGLTPIPPEDATDAA